MTADTQEMTNLAEQAADWVTQLEDEPTPESRAKLVAWLRLSPRHVEEFLLVQATYRAFYDVRPEYRIDLQELLSNQAANVVPLRESTTATVLAADAAPAAKIGAVTRRRPPLPIAAAASILGITAGLWLFVYAGDGETYTTN